MTLLSVGSHHSFSERVLGGLSSLACSLLRCPQRVRLLLCNSFIILLSFFRQTLTFECQVERILYTNSFDFFFFCLDIFLFCSPTCALFYMLQCYVALVLSFYKICTFDKQVRFMRFVVLWSSFILLKHTHLHKGDIDED